MSGQTAIPTLTELAQYNPNRPDQVEGLKWSLYDSLTYATTGQSQLTFFQQPQGGTANKTLANTDMTAAGALPAPQSFLITGIQLFFFPGDLISTYGAGAASAFINDTYKFWTQPAWLELFIGSKPYLDEAPLLKFPPANGMSGFAGISDSTTAGAAQQSQIGYASAGGMPYEVNPPVLLVATQNFKVTLNWPALVTITAAATVYCNLTGFLYRNSQ
jgi:hypothetical protein